MAGSTYLAQGLACADLTLTSDYCSYHSKPDSVFWLSLRLPLVVQLADIHVTKGAVQLNCVAQYFNITYSDSNVLWRRPSTLAIAVTSIFHSGSLSLCVQASLRVCLCSAPPIWQPYTSLLIVSTASTVALVCVSSLCI